MKSILVIDTPKSCKKCPMWVHTYFVDCGKDYFYEACCLGKDKCLLKPMPEKKEVEVNKIEDIMHTEYSIEDIYTNKYIATIQLAADKLISLGWNACLEEIEK